MKNPFKHEQIRTGHLSQQHVRSLSARRDLADADLPLEAASPLGERDSTGPVLLVAHEMWLSSQPSTST